MKSSALVVASLFLFLKANAGFINAPTDLTIGSKGNQLQWNTASAGIIKIDLVSSRDSSTITLANGVTVSSFIVDIPWNVYPGQYNIKLYTFSSGTLVDQFSTSVNLILPIITFTIPSGGPFSPGSSFGVQWSGSGFDSTKYLNGMFSIFAVDSTAAGGAATYQVANVNDIISGSALLSIPSSIPGGQYKIRLTNNYVVWESQTSFQISSLSQSSVAITITSPGAGAVWLAQQTATVRWTCNGCAATASIKVMLVQTTAGYSDIFCETSATAYSCSRTVPAINGTFFVSLTYNNDGNLVKNSSNFFVSITSTSSSNLTSIIGGAAAGVFAVCLIVGITFGVKRYRRRSGESQRKRAVISQQATDAFGGVIVSDVAKSDNAGYAFRADDKQSISTATGQSLTGGLSITPDLQRRLSGIQSRGGSISPGTMPGQLPGIGFDSSKQKAYYEALFSSSLPGSNPISPEATRLYNPIKDEDLTDYLFTTLTAGSVVLGRYRIKGAPIKGGTAVVRLATDEKTDKKVAIKLAASQEEAINELRILKNLRSPFIVSLEDSYVLPQLSSPLIIMESLDKSLNDFVRSRQLDVQAIKLILSHIISGVEHIHASNLVHCDLKPANIMLASADIQWKIIDFGNTKTALSDDVNGLTPMYSPPEVATAVLANRLIKAHPSIDLWQIGVIIYYMFTRSLPFDDIVGEKDILHRLAEPGFSLDLNGISDVQARNLLSKIFVDDPKRRLALDKIKKSAFLNSGLDTVQMEQAAGAGASIYGQKLGSKLDSLINDVAQVKDLTAQAVIEIKATRRQIYEHQEYQCPRLLLVLPSKSLGSDWNPKKWFTESYKLYLLCEHDECIHFTSHEGYELVEPKHFMRKAAPILSLTLTLVNAALNAALGISGAPSAVLNFLRSIEDSPVCQLIPRRREESNEKDRAIETADYLRKFHGQLSPVVQHEIDSTPGTTDISKLVGPALRELQMMLKEMDPKSNWGGLQAVSTSDGQIRYVCPKHAQFYHLHQN